MERGGGGGCGESEDIGERAEGWGDVHCGRSILVVDDGLLAVKFGI